MATRFFRSYGEGRLFRPSPDVQRAVLRDSREYILTRFAAGKRRGRVEISEILRTLFDFFALRLNSLLKKVASREFMEFLLYQYDLATERWRSIPNETSSGICQALSQLAVTRRSLKHLAERTTMMSYLPEFAPAGIPGLFRFVDEVFFVSDMLTEVYLAGDMAYYILPGEMELTLHERDVVCQGDPWPIPFTLLPDTKYNDLDFVFFARVIKDVSNRHRYFPDGSLNLDFQTHTHVLDPFFEQSFRCSFSNILAAIASINDQCRPAPGSFPVMFFQKKDLVNDVVRNFGASDSLARTIISGFTVTRRQMLEEQRKIFHPKQKYRAFRRGYFEFPHSNGVHLFWGRALAQEAFDNLVNGLCFKKLPNEWITQDTTAGLEKLSNVAGLWFEAQVASKFQDLGIVGSGRKGRIRFGDKCIDIPVEVGQLDFLGYSERDCALVLAEAKMVEVGFESRFFRDEISDFAIGTQSHVSQLRKKKDWVGQNRHLLADVLGIGRTNLKVISAIVTLYPTYAACRVVDFPCVSLVEVMENYAKMGRWPYDFGIF